MTALDRAPRARHVRRLSTLAVLAVVLIAAALTGCVSSTVRPGVTMEEDPSLPNHTIFRPTNLQDVDGELPVVLWGEGGCIAPGSTYANFLSEIAAAGYLVIADLPLAGVGLDTPEIMLEGATWAIAENVRPGSKWFGRLDTDHIAAMGQSCGGLVALHAGTDPRISTVVAWNSGIFDVGGLGGASKDDLANLQGPTMWVNSGPLDIAYPQAEKDFNDPRTTVPAVWANLDLSDRGGSVLGAHLATFFEPKGGAFTPVAIAWLDFTLKGDRKAGKTFLGPCHLCDEPGWTVQSKNWHHD